MTNLLPKTKVSKEKMLTIKQKLAYNRYDKKVFFFSFSFQLPDFFLSFFLPSFFRKWRKITAVIYLRWPFLKYALVNNSWHYINYYLVLQFYSAYNFFSLILEKNRTKNISLIRFPRTGLPITRHLRKRW